MTAQAAEKIIIADETISLLSNPLESYIKDKGLKFAAASTACWRGYVGTWELKDNALYLVDFIGNVRTWENSSQVDINYLFPNETEIKATWFTGKLRVPIGKMAQYVHGGYGSSYTKELEFDIKNGNIIQILHKEFQFEIETRKGLFDEEGEEEKYLKVSHVDTTEITWRELISLIKRNQNNSTFDEIYSHLQVAAMSEKANYQKGILDNLNKAIEIDANCSDAYINRALYYRHHKNYQEAQKDYEKALSLQPNGFEIVLFNEEDIFKYGKCDGVYKYPNPPKKQGKLQIDMYLSTKKQSESDTFIFVEAQALPYFFFRKIYKKPICNHTFAKFEFAIAKALFYLTTDVFGRKVKPIQVL
ncbi:MAG: tetratricopeptide repeat protein [Candidatus Symbiothrix sp.]|jgi:tetratricopeptide (TPR) repeat protein|nr:tetratricopeptide repeat protein [Candidatus Symbiothrix sp.]